MTPRDDAVEDGLSGSLIDLTAILAHVGDGVTVQDRSGRLIYANEGAVRALGFATTEELLATPSGEVASRFVIYDAAGELLPLERLPGRRAMAGEVEPGLTIRFRILATGEDRWSVVRAAPIRDATGKVRYAVNFWQDVTAQKHAELRDRSLAAIVETADDAIIGKTIDGVVTSWNPGAARLYGYTAEEMIGQSLLRIFPDDRKDELGHILARLRSGERIEHHETTRVTRDGRRVDVSMSISPLFDSAGTVIGAATIARNVTEQKREEVGQRFLAEVGELLAGSLDVETTMETVAKLVVPWLADWCAIHLVRANRRIDPVTIAHVDPEKVAWARALQERLPVDPDASTGVPKVIRTGVSDFFPMITPAMIDATITDPERRALITALQLSAAIVVPLTARGRTIGAISLFRAESGGQYDEEDLELAEELARRAALSVDNAQLYEATRAAEARFRAIYEGAAEAILLIDQQGRIVDVNEAAVQLVGYSRDELRLMPDGAETLLVDRAQASDLPALQKQGAWHREIVVRRKDGKTVPVETHVAAVELSEGRVFLALWHDISDRKAAERFEDEFLAQLTHDLLNPLTSARLQSQLLRRWATTGRLESGRVEGAAANVEAETYRIAQRLEELAALARKRLYPMAEPIASEASPKLFNATA